MVLKRSKYGLNTGNSLVHASTGRAKDIRNKRNGSTNGPSARIVKRIVIPTTTANDGSSTSADNEFKLMTMEQKRQLIEQIEQQLTEHVDGGMQAAIVTTHNGQQVSVPYREFLDQPSLPGNENDENQPPLRDLFQKSKKAPYGSAALEQPNLNRQSSTSHNCDITYSGNKKKRWELMDEVKQALHANNIDLDTFRGRIVAYTSVPTVNTTTGNNKPRVGVTTFSTNSVANVQRVGKHDVVIATDNKTDNDNAETADIVADRKTQSKKSKRNAKQRKCSANVLTGSSSGSKSKKDFTATVPGVQLVYDFIEPLPVNNSFELGKRSYNSDKCYHGASARSRAQKAKDAVALHMAEQRLVLSPAPSTEQKPSMTESGVSQVAEKPANEAPIVEDNPIWGFISAALKKEARTTQTELNRAGWIVLDIIEQQQEESDNKRNNSTGSSNDDDDQDEEAEYDAFDDDNVSVSTDKSESFEKPNVGVVDADKQPDEEEEDADGFVLFDVKQLQKQTNS